MSHDRTDRQPAHENRRIIELRSAKYDGSLNYYWPACMVQEDAAGFIWATPAGAPFTRPGGVHPVPHDWLGRVWYDRWYAVDASLAPPSRGAAPGTLLHYYCNLGMPGAWEGDVYRYVDLDLDVQIFPDGRHVLLDEDEFAAHQLRYGYPADVVAATEQAARDAVALAQAGAAPFDGSLVAWHAALHAAGSWDTATFGARMTSRGGEGR
jgi:protein associated with RNAse G/E